MSTAPPLEFHYVGHEDFRPPRLWIVKSLIPAGSLVVAYGPPGSGKSIACADLATAIAAGRPFLGREVMQGAVLYLALERGSQTYVRLTVQSDMAGGGLPVVCYSRRIDLTEHGDDAEQLVAMCDRIDADRGPLRLIIIDTMARAFSGDENSAKDVGRFVKTIDRIRDSTQATVVVVHHSSKPGGQGRRKEKASARGSNALIGAADIALSIEGTRGQHFVTVDKANDSVTGVSLKFGLKVITIDDTAEGEIGDIAIVQHDDDEDSGSTSHQDARQRALLEIIRSEPAIARSELLARAREAGIVSQAPASSSEQVRVSLGILKSRGLIYFDSKTVRLI